MRERSMLGSPGRSREAGGEEAVAEAAANEAAREELEAEAAREALIEAAP